MDNHLSSYFRFDDRIELWVPCFQSEWDEMDIDLKHALATQWNQLKGEIPEKIRDREKIILDLIDQMYLDVDFETFCQLNSDMIDLAAEINELNIWSRYQPTVTEVSGHHLDTGRAHF